MEQHALRKITSKRIFYQLYYKNLLGNTVPQYTWQDWLGEVYYCGPSTRTKYALRDSSTAMSQFTRMNMTVSECYRYGVQCIKEGLKEEHINISENIPAEYTVLHGEVTELLGIGFVLRYSRVKDFLRQAFQKESLQAFNGHAKAILRHCLDGSSYDDLMDFSYMYPEHVVEFTSYSRNVGTLSHRNTIFWEVRLF